MGNTGIHVVEAKRKYCKKKLKSASQTEEGKSGFRCHSMGHASLVLTVLAGRREWRHFSCQLCEI